MKKFILFFLAVLSLVILGLATEAKTTNNELPTEKSFNNDIASIVIE